MAGEKKEGMKLDPVHILLVIAILAFTAILIYSPHFEYKYPFHIDELHHSEMADRIVYDPVHTLSNELKAGNFEIGYHVFLAGLFACERSVGIDPILAYKFLPAAFAVLASLILFFMMLRLTKNYWIGIFSMLFFATLKTNVNLLGLWFAVPLTFCIPLIFLFFYLFIVGWNEKPVLLIWAALVFVFIAISHAPSATFMVPVLVIYMIINHKSANAGAKSKRWLHIAFFIVPVLACLAIYFGAVSKGSFIESMKFILDKLVFRYGFTPAEAVLLPLIKIPFLKKVIMIHPYFIPYLYGIGAFVFAAIGALVSFKNKKLHIFTIWALITSFFLALFVNFNFTIFAPYQRMVYYTLLGLVPLSAIGLINAVDWISRKKIKMGNVLIVIIVALTFYLSFCNYYVQPKGFEIYNTITDNDYAALKFMNNYANNKIVFAPLRFGDAIYPLSKNNAVVSPFFIGNDDTRWDMDEFMSSENCSRKQEIVNAYKPDYIISENAINCSEIGLELIYNEGDYIYKVVKS
jgi:hypothetical protein